MTIQHLQNAPLAYLIWFAGYDLPFKSGVNHFSLMGTTGSGKTTFIRLMMQSFIPYIGQTGEDFDQRAVIYDVKQEMLSILFGAGVNPEKIILLHPYDERGATWDIARDITTESEALQFATALVPETNENTRFFNDATRDLVSSTITALNYLAPKNWDFRDVIVPLSNQQFLEPLLKACPYTEDRLQYFENAATAANILMTVRSKIAPFRPIAACWHHATERVSLAEWIKEKNGSFLVLGHSERLREPLSAINRLIFQRLVELTLDLEESDERRIWYVLDEVRHLGKVEGLPGLLTNGRSKGAAVILGFQDYSGMCAVWGEHIANEIIAMCANQAYLRLSSGATAQYASDQFSFLYQPVTETSETLTTTWGQNPSTSEAKSTQSKMEKQERIMPGDFLSMPIASPKNGIPGAYISPWFKEVDPGKTTFYQTTLRREASFDRLMSKSATKDNFIERPPEQERLEPWDEDDFKRIFGPDWQQLMLKPEKRAKTTKPKNPKDQALDAVGRAGSPKEETKGRTPSRGKNISSLLNEVGFRDPE